MFKTSKTFKVTTSREFLLQPSTSWEMVPPTEDMVKNIKILFFFIDEGNAKVYDMITFLETNLAGYRGALEADTGNIMVSYSAINDIAMTISNTLL